MDRWGDFIGLSAAWPVADAARLGAGARLVVCDRAGRWDGAWAVHSGDHSPLHPAPGQPARWQRHGDSVHHYRMLANCFIGFLVGAGSG